MIARTLVGAALLAAVVPPARAQIAPAPLLERTVKPGAAGPNHLPVDSALLVGASPFESSSRRGLGDLRLHDDATGRDVPYLLVWPSEDPPVWRDGRIIPVSPGKDTSGFEVDLGNVLTVDRVEVPTLPVQFLKRVRVEGSGDRVRWTMLVPEGALFNLPDESGGALRQTQLGFAPGAYRYLRLIWDDHAGPRLATPPSARARLARRDGLSADTLRQTLGFERRPSATRTSRYHIRLPATRLPIVALELEVGGAQVLRNAFVTEPRLGNGRVTPTQLGTAVLRRRSLGDAVAADLRIPITSPTGAELDLVIQDADNPPLDLRAIRAVLAPIPYIYFESPNGAGLRATYGTDRRQSITPPQYDLEALRDTVKRIAATVATWGPVREARVATAADSAPRALYAAPGAPLDVKSFAYARSIPAATGLTALRLDPAALAHSRIEDVRIVDAEGRQVPYLLEMLDEPTEVALGAPDPTRARENIDRRVVADAGKRSWYRLRVPYTNLPDASLRLATNARVFARDVTVITRELARDAEPDASLDRAATMPWTHDDPDAPAPPLEISIGGRLRSDSLFLLVNDGDNRKLPITSATLLLPSYRLRFFRDPSVALTLLYGRADLPAPRYDLALIAPRLLDAPAEEIAAEPERGNPSAHGNAPRLVFWGVLAAAVAVLLVMIARLVRAGPEGAPTSP